MNLLDGNLASNYSFNSMWREKKNAWMGWRLQYCPNLYSVDIEIRFSLYIGYPAAVEDKTSKTYTGSASKINGGLRFSFLISTFHLDMAVCSFSCWIFCQGPNPYYEAYLMQIWRLDHPKKEMIHKEPVKDLKFAEWQYSDTNGEVLQKELQSRISLTDIWLYKL